MTTIKRFLSILLLFFLFHSCSVFDPPGQIPSYIHIDSIGLTANYTTDGTASHKITDAWVYVDQVLNGVYAMPATIPILASGVHEIDVHPGILVDGIQATRESYPFYTFYSNNYNLTTQQITTINPTVTYYPGIVPTWYEDFRSGMTMQNVSPGIYDTLKIVPTNAFPGETPNCGYAYLYYTPNNINTSYFEYNTSIFPLPTDGSRSVYLEMNYMSTNTIRVGVLPIDPTNSYTYIDDTVLEINPSLTWNKIYIDLTSVCGSYPGSSFRIFIAALLDPGLNNAQIYIDNLKLLHQ
jgi:hypothetical protein